MSGPTNVESSASSADNSSELQINRSASVVAFSHEKDGKNCVGSSSARTTVVSEIRERIPIQKKMNL